MRKFYSNITISLVMLILIATLSLSFIIGQLLQTFYTEQFEQQLFKKASYISAFLNDSEAAGTDRNQAVAKINSIFATEFIMIDKKTHKIEGTSNLSMFVTVKHKKSIVDTISKDSYLVDTITINNEKMFFSHVKTSNSNFKDVYLIMLSDSKQLDEMLNKVTKLIIISFSIGLFVILFFGTSIMQNATKASVTAKVIVDELTKGNFHQRVDDLEKINSNPLNRSLIKLVASLQKLSVSNQMQQNRLSTLVENIGSGLIFIDSHGLITLINGPGRKILQIADGDYENKHYYELIDNKEVIKLIEEIFMTEQNVRRQIAMSTKIERHDFEVYGAPIIGENSSWKGTILVFHNITELKKLENIRKDFVANVSHELKTPITSIRGFSETLLDGACDDEEVLQSFLLIILKESERLQSLLQDLLDLSKIEDEQYELIIQKFDAVFLLEEVTMLLMKRAEEKQITLIFDKSHENIFVSADLDRIKQLFLNLINNAITYTQENGYVTIKLDNYDGHIKVSVTDSGIGIVKEEIPRIFERFYRVDRARSRDSGGTGLGLAIVKHIVEAHNGKINVESELGVGTKFIITIPKEQKKQR